MVRRRFGVEYTLAGLDLLLHRIGWRVQVPARQATERDEKQITAWKEDLKGTGSLQPQPASPRPQKKRKSSGQARN